MSHLRVHGLKTHLNHMMNMHWFLVMKLKMAYLRAHHWESEGEALGSEEGIVLGTGEVIKLGSPYGGSVGASGSISTSPGGGSDVGGSDVATLLGTDEEWSCLGLLDGKVLGFSVVGSQHSQLSYPFPPSKQLC